MRVALCLSVHISWVKLSVVALSFSVLYEYWSITHFCHLFGIVSPHLCHNCGWTSVREHILWSILLITYFKCALFFFAKLGYYVALSREPTRYTLVHNSCSVHVCFILQRKTDFIPWKCSWVEKRLNNATRKIIRNRHSCEYSVLFLQHQTLENMSNFAQRISVISLKNIYYRAKHLYVSISIVLGYFELEVNGILKL